MWLTEWKKERDSANIPLLLLFPFTPAPRTWKGPPRASGWPVGCVLCEGPRPRHNTTHSSAGHHSWAGMWPASDWALCVCVKYKWKEEDLDGGMSTTEQHMHRPHEPFEKLRAEQKNHNARVFSIIFIHFAIMFHKSLNEHIYIRNKSRKINTKYRSSYTYSVL